MTCTGICVGKYILLVGSVLEKLWNSPLRKIFEDLVRQPQLSKFPNQQ